MQAQMKEMDLRIRKNTTEIQMITKAISNLSSLEAKMSLIVNRNKLLVNGGVIVFLLIVTGIINGLITWFVSRGGIQ